MLVIKYQNFLFDLDGTLSDPQVGIISAMQYALQSFGIEETHNNLKRYIGPPLACMMGDYLPQQEIENGIAKYREYFGETGLYENNLYEGISQLLNNLRIEGANIYLATSKPEEYAKKILAHFQIEHYFHDIAGSSMQKHTETKADIIQLVINRNHLVKNTCVMVGDREHDLIGANKAGISSVGVLYGFGSKSELLKEHPQYIADTVKSLETWLLNHVDRG